jgi:hypothetical protein
VDYKSPLSWATCERRENLSWFCAFRIFSTLTILTLLDPTGASLTLINEQGGEIGHILYNAFGGVLSENLSPELEAALADQGTLDDPDTGLIHLGSGRWYDPSLGRPLQPNPVGGPPMLPQALNRYAATPLGQPGVAQGATSEGYNWAPDTFGILKGAALDAASLSPVVVGYSYTGQANIAVQASRSALTRKIPKALRSSFGDLNPTSKSSIYERTAQIVLEGSTEAELRLAAKELEATLIAALPSRGAWKAKVLSEVLIDSVAQEVKLGRFFSFKVLKAGLGPVFDAGIGGYLQYLDDRDNPYLTPIQKGFRAGIAGTGSVLAGTGTLYILSALGCTATIYCGIAAGIIGTISWVTIGQPVIFEVIPGLQPADRNLQPLNIP